jgi:hypothetical protein
MPLIQFAHKIIHVISPRPTWIARRSRTSICWHPTWLYYCYPVAIVNSPDGITVVVLIELLLQDLGHHKHSGRWFPSCSIHCDTWELQNVVSYGYIICQTGKCNSCWWQQWYYFLQLYPRLTSAQLQNLQLTRVPISNVIIIKRAIMKSVDLVFFLFSWFFASGGVWVWLVWMLSGLY